ncbi:PQQ-dependent sugar dehydrogenase [Paracoccus sp. MBLB3053]|uniref:PQQ-dependent sugar dehydrogenase n=1 Tax=Paracoccus aurantius TaxID=3073814 RepID=A0ABU2HNQ7_9RHOB|nr:PQQ-dependent sugar dehydrogenase [Paracoccus sp. MBLB3053]MDS9466677.1 PQQ-dependent sugar dehydrogenase [Paracoccus sp. MBLB3053]
MKHLSTLILLAGLAGSPTLGQTLYANPPHAEWQTPAFKNQTRAPVLRVGIHAKQEILATGLEKPWGLALLPDGGWLITEKPGRMRLFRDGKLSEPLKGLDMVEGELLDVAVAKDFAATRQIWWSFWNPAPRDNATLTVGTGVLSESGDAIEDARIIFQEEPLWGPTLHFGARLVPDNEGHLFLTSGDRENEDIRMSAQDVNTVIGKVLRIDAQTGKGVKGNPFFEGGGKPEIWSWGHRNPQAADLDDQGRLWTIEHGPMGGDEVNKPEPGRNYGWPIITYGQDYDGEPFGDGITQHEGMEQPIYYWDPSIAPGGAAFYRGDMFPDLQGDLLVGGLNSEALFRLRLKDDRVFAEQQIAKGMGRIRDVAVAPDGSIVVLTDAEDGKFIRLSR